MPEPPPGVPEPSGNLKDEPKDLDCCRFFKGICKQTMRIGKKDHT